ncbi:hypothetical protein D3C81_1525690 [compost metagenome]
MGLLHAHGLVALGLPVLVEGGVVFLVQLAGRVIGHVEQGGLCLYRSAQGKAGEGGQGETTNGHAVAPCCVPLRHANQFGGGEGLGWTSATHSPATAVVEVRAHGDTRAHLVVMARGHVHALR